MAGMILTRTPPVLPAVLCVVEGNIPTVDIAVIQPFNWLRAQNRLTYEVVIVHNVTKKRIAAADIVLFVRGADPLNQEWLDTALDKKKRILYLLDDNFFELPMNTPIGRYYSRPNIVATITRLLATADLSILGSPLLIDAMPVRRDRALCLPFVYPHFVKPIVPATNRTIIGYFGTASHKDDFAAIAPALREVLAKNQNTYLEICGFTTLHGLKDFAERITFFPYDDDYRRFMHSLSQKQWRIGLAPLVDTPSNRCKTDVKYRDFSAYGLPTVYSRVEPYVSKIREGYNGLLAGTNEEWVEALNSLIQSPELCQYIGQNALRDIRTNNSVARVASLWMTEVFGRLDHLPPNPHTAKMHSFYHRIAVSFRICQRKLKETLKTITPNSVLRLYRYLRWGVR